MLVLPYNYLKSYAARRELPIAYPRFPACHKTILWAQGHLLCGFLPTLRRLGIRNGFRFDARNETCVCRILFLR